MNSTERVRNVILGKPVDRQPIYGWVSANLSEEITKEYGDVLKWFKRPHSKCDRPGNRCEGSNPSISAIVKKSGFFPLFFAILNMTGMRNREGASVRPEVR